MSQVRLSFNQREPDELQTLLLTVAALQPDDEVETVVEPEPDTSITGFAAETVVLAIFGIAALGTMVTRLVDWLRDRDDCLVTVDVRTIPVDIRERCDIEGQRGRVLMIGSDGQQIVLTQPPNGVDLTPFLSGPRTASELADAAERMDLQLTAEGLPISL